MEPVAREVRRRQQRPSHDATVDSQGRFPADVGDACAKLRGTGRPQLAVAKRRWRDGQGAFWGDQIGPNPTDRGKPGTKRSVIVEANGGPLGVVVAGANVHDCRLLQQTIEAIVVDRPKKQKPSAEGLVSAEGKESSLPGQTTPDKVPAGPRQTHSPARLLRSRTKHSRRSQAGERLISSGCFGPDNVPVPLDRPRRRLPKHQGKRDRDQEEREKDFFAGSTGLSGHRHIPQGMIHLNITIGCPRYRRAEYRGVPLRPSQSLKVHITGIAGKTRNPPPKNPRLQRTPQKWRAIGEDSLGASWPCIPTVGVTKNCPTTD